MMSKEKALSINWMLAKGALLGFLAVLLGASGSHWLGHLLDAAEQRAYQTAVSYQFYHALALLFTGLLYAHARMGSLLVAGYLFAIGTVLFSGSIYLLTLTESMRWLGPVTPLGGLCLMGGWAVLLVAAIRRWRR
ncbi:MAG: DUF423 domain-containing protein [Chitinophagales bacterium]|nr:DUF423 domain-containing protein [Chitinophagales bacterium]MDW8392658.1 DUF423 domain-containing protein [Chitinophagales bacterium]